MTYYERLTEDREALNRFVELGLIDFRVQVHLHIFEKHKVLCELGVKDPTRQLAESSRYSKRNIQMIISKMKRE